MKSAHGSPAEGDSEQKMVIHVPRRYTAVFLDMIFDVICHYMFLVFVACLQLGGGKTLKKSTKSHAFEGFAIPLLAISLENSFQFHLSFFRAKGPP